MWLNGALLLIVGLGPMGANCWSEDSWIFWQLQTSAFRLGKMVQEFTDGLEVQATLYWIFIGMLGAKISHEIINSSVANYSSSFKLGIIWIFTLILSGCAGLAIWLPEAAEFDAMAENTLLGLGLIGAVVGKPSYRVLLVLLTFCVCCTVWTAGKNFTDVPVLEISSAWGAAVSMAFGLAYGTDGATFCGLYVLFSPFVQALPTYHPAPLIQQSWLQSNCDTGAPGHEMTGAIGGITLLGLVLAYCTGGAAILDVFCLALPLAQAVCPYCSDNQESCSFATDGKCPAAGEVAINAAVIGGVAAMAGRALSVKISLLPRFIRAVGSGALAVVTLLANKPAKGTAFEFDADTPANVVMAAIAVGRYTTGEALLRIAELQAGLDPEEEGGADKKTMLKLDRLLKLLEAAGKANTFNTSVATASDGGVYTFLWGKVTEFVYNKEMQVKVQLPGAENKESEGSTSSKVFSASIRRLTSEMEFAEALNLFIMFTSAIGLVTAPIVTQFLEFVVFDTVRQRGESWQVAGELLIVMLRRIEDSGGSLTFANAFNESHLNAYIDEARRNAAHFYENAPKFFRTRGGNPGTSNLQGTIVWNKKFNPKSNRCCAAFNNKTEHNLNQLQECGTCKFNHVCSKWVKDKGKYGKCMQNHSMLECTNPQRCDEPIKA